jgi:hypothetical protein
MACSIYRSEGRKTFESKAPQKIQALLASLHIQNKPHKTQDCEILTQFELETRANTLSVSPEIIALNNELEIWKNYSPEGTVQITMIEPLAQKNLQNSMRFEDTIYSLCHYEFKSELDWQNAELNLTLDH